VRLIFIIHALIGEHFELEQLIALTYFSVHASHIVATPAVATQRTRSATLHKLVLKVSLFLTCRVTCNTGCWATAAHKEMVHPQPYQHSQKKAKGVCFAP